MAGVGGYNGWRWIFIMEGLLTIVVAVIGKFFIVDWPETSNFLTSEERKILLRRLREGVAEAKMDRMDKKSTCRVFTDWKIWIGYVMLTRDAVLSQIFCKADNFLIARSCTLASLSLAIALPSSLLLF